MKKDKSHETFIKLYKKYLKSTPIIKAINQPSKSQLSNIYKNQMLPLYINLLIRKF